MTKPKDDNTKKKAEPSKKEVVEEKIWSENDKSRPGWKPKP